VCSRIAETQVNHPPIVDAGLDTEVCDGDPQAFLTGTATDDGLPTSTLTHTWSKVSGPGTVTFSDPNSLTSSASFDDLSSPYILRLTADDSQLKSSDDLTVTFRHCAG